ncbi:WD40-repeat-containing domain protein [Apiospora kogelbergensis]|uniref:WD40-repeat-containing domain protein n=1 Tax=Apiospora kogelbergensis TaxID=1337665 RepID=A0AAW0RB33_9PEZI
MTRSIGAKRNKEDGEDEDRRDRKRVARGDSGAVNPTKAGVSRSTTDIPSPLLPGLGHYTNQGVSNFSGQYSLESEASLHQGNTTNVYQTANRCLADLRVTDPCHDKKRIEETKGGLLRDAYVWVLENRDLCRWRNNPDQRLLWVKGDPGKGKTMLLCGIIDYLEEKLRGSDPQRNPMDRPGRTLGSGTETEARPATSTDDAAQPSGLRIKQGGSTFKSNITLTGNASSKQGNKITGITQGDVDQKGSEFSGDVKAGDKAQTSQGNQINGMTPDADQLGAHPVAGRYGQ